MCRTYKLTCPLCDRITLQLYYCTELNDRGRAWKATNNTQDLRSANGTSASNTVDLSKPTQSDCPSFNADSKPQEPAIAYTAPDRAACKHLCRFCDFEFWYELHADDQMGRAVWSEEEARKRMRNAKAERHIGGGRERRWVEPA